MQQSIYSVIFSVSRWRAAWQIKRASIRIAADIYPSLWESVLRKVGSSTASELAAYANLRAGQLCHEKVDQFMQAESDLSGELASRLIVKSTARAVAAVLAAADRLRRTAA